jgi:hypothetical protein
MHDPDGVPDPNVFYNLYKTWIQFALNGGIGNLNSHALDILHSVNGMCTRYEAIWDVHGDAGTDETCPKFSPQWEQTLLGLKANIDKANEISPFNEYKESFWKLYPSEEDLASQAWFAALPDEGQNIINQGCDRIDAALNYWEAVARGEADDIPPVRRSADRDDPYWTEQLRNAMGQLAAIQQPQPEPLAM